MVATELSNGADTWDIGTLFADTAPLIIDTRLTLSNTFTHQILGARGVGFDIKNYLDDADGCRMRITFVHKLSHEVRFMEANLVVAPRDLTHNPNGVTQRIGRTLQQPGSGELNWTFDDTTLHWIVDGWAGPWIRCLDFYPGVPIGQPDELPQPDPNKMRVWFHLHPHVAARIVILD